MYIIAKKATHYVVEVNGLIGNIDINSFKSAIATNYGGAPEDYEVYQTTEEETERLQNLDSYIAIWSDDIITGLDFSLEDSKLWVRFNLNKTKIKANGTDIAILTAQVWTPDNIAIDTSYNGTATVEFDQNGNVGLIDLIFVNGVYTVNIKSTDSGIYVFPLRKKITDDSNNSIKVDQNYIATLKLLAF